MMGWDYHLSWYGLLVLTYLLLQVILAHAEYCRQRRSPRPPVRARVTVIVPTYNEPLDVLQECVASIFAQTYEGFPETFVIDDGSDPPYRFNRSDFPVQDTSQRTLAIFALPYNQGKRRAQYAGFQKSTGEYIITVDSDTRLAPDAINNLVALFAQPRVGAITGAVRVDPRPNLLAWLIDLRYWSAFHQERAAQSFFGVMSCCSGVLSAYRKSLIDAVKERYVTQTFLGKECIFGDDRHLTNLALWLGYETRFAHDAPCTTRCPLTIQQWMRQQRRWSQSFYREFLWSLRFVHRRNFYFLYTLSLSAFLPLCLLYGLGAAAYHTIAAHWLLSLRYVAAVVVVALLRGLYGFYRTKEWAFLLMPFYGFLHLVCVLPVRVYALFTLRNNGWGTRGQGVRAEYAPLEVAGRA